jgi:hypothetical protein
MGRLMGRSKWLLILLLPMLFGFDTRNPFRTRGPIKISDFPTGGGSGLGELFDAPNSNINTSYDAICDPATATANGIIFCDGFEDGSMTSNAAATPSTATDGWWLGSTNGQPRQCAPGVDPCVDPAGTDFTECNANPSDFGMADFGAAGTPCTATQGWNRDIEPSHCFKVDGSADQGECATNHTLDVQNFRFRGYFKLAGESSTRCPAGYPNCPTFNFWTPGDNTNGPKFVELRDGLDAGGISYVNIGVPVDNNATPRGDLYFGVNTPGVSGTLDANVGKTCASGITADGTYCTQHLNLPKFNYYDAANRNDWIFIEVHIKQTDTNDASELRMWMNNCGQDGLTGCVEGVHTPTLRIQATNWDINPQEPAYSISDALYLNGWTDGNVDGEIQWDEIVIADGDTKTSPIGFFKPQ